MASRPDSPVLPPDRELVRRLGRGASAEVFLVRTRGTRELRVLKRIRLGAAAPWAPGRVDREIRLLAKVEHPNVVRLHGVERHPEGIDLEFEYLPGRTLDEVFPPGAPAAPDEVAPILGDVLAGLEALHRVGILHRDLKPANVLLADSGRAVLLDLGLAKGIADREHLTATGQIPCTPLYAAPELFRSRPASVRSDLYAVGMTGYRLLTGRHPFDEASSLIEVMECHLSVQPPPLRQVVPGIPRGLEALVHQMLAKTPDDRPASAAAAQLRMARGAPPAAGLAAATPLPGAASLPGAPAPRRRGGAWGVLAVLLLLGGLTASTSTPRLRPPPRAWPAVSPAGAGAEDRAAAILGDVAATLRAWPLPDSRDPLGALGRLGAGPALARLRALRERAPDDVLRALSRDLIPLAREADSLDAPPVLAPFLVGPPGAPDASFPSRARALLEAAGGPVPALERSPGLVVEADRLLGEARSGLRRVEAALRLDPGRVGGTALTALALASLAGNLPPDAWWYVIAGAPSPAARAALHTAFRPLLPSLLQGFAALAAASAASEPGTELADGLAAWGTLEIEDLRAPLALALLYVPTRDLVPGRKGPDTDLLAASLDHLRHRLESAAGAPRSGSEPAAQAAAREAATAPGGGAAGALRRRLATALLDRIQARELRPAGARPP